MKSAIDTAKATTDDEWREWTRKHRVRYEVRPLLAMQGDTRVQAGFELELFAGLPPMKAGEPREPAIREVMKGLGDLARLVFPFDSKVARVELAPSHGLAQMSRETGFRPEVRRSVKVVHREDVWRSVEEGERDKLIPFERRLKELGVKAGSR